MDLHEKGEDEKGMVVSGEVEMNFGNRGGRVLVLTFYFASESPGSMFTMLSLGPLTEIRIQAIWKNSGFCIFSELNWETCRDFKF